MTEPAVLTGLASLAGRYDAALLDVWGVLHDGVKPTLGALDCLARLRAAGWRLVLLSNAPRSASSTRTQIAGFGIPPASYDDVVTSGELTRAALAQRVDPWHAALGRRFYHLGPARDWGLLDGLDYQRVQEVAGSDFILNTGLFDDDTETAETYAPFLQTARQHAIPMICANPDISVMRGSRSIPCAGAIAVAYQAIGGNVCFHGKPHAGAYAACFRLLDGVPPRRILAVGDSLVTDIRGAVGAGIDSVFVMDGIHVSEIKGNPTAAYARTGITPTAAIPTFRW